MRVFPILPAAALAILPCLAPSAVAHPNHPSAPGAGTTTNAPASTSPNRSTTPRTETVKLRFTAVAGDQPVRCGEPITGLGSTNATATLEDLRFYVSEVKLLRRNGAAVPLSIPRTTAFRAAGTRNGVTLIDLEDGRGSCAGVGTSPTNRTVIGRVPRGRYTGVRFTLGVPFARNHTNTVGATRPLSLAAMAWSWQAGRKFAKIELADADGPNGTWSAERFMVHLGSTGCEGNPLSGETVRCSAPNRVRVHLGALNPARDTIALDLRALLSGNDITRNAGGSPGCMSAPTDPECPAIFAALGLPSATGPAKREQRVFRAVRR